MSLNKFEKDMNIIAALDDEPNDVGGMSSEELKAKFDEGGNAVKDYINNDLLPRLEGTGGAGSVGAAPFGAITGDTVQEQLEQLDGKINDTVMGAIPDGSIATSKLADGAVTTSKLGADVKGVLKSELKSFYLRFETSDWTGAHELRIPASRHGLHTGLPIVSSTLNMRIGRTAGEYDEESVAAAEELFLALNTAALAANSAAAGTYPTAEDGHLELTWAQVQYYLLEEVLASAETAEAKAEELGFDWQEIPNGTEQTVTLDELLAAAYLPGLGVPNSRGNLDALWTLAAVKGLRFRRRTAAGEGYYATYDLEGSMRGHTWACMETEVEMDTKTGDLVVTYTGDPYPGELLALAAPAGE